MANSILSMKNDVILEILESEYAEIYGIDLRSGMIAPLFVENSLAKRLGPDILKEQSITEFAEKYSRNRVYGIDHDLVKSVMTVPFLKEELRRKKSTIGYYRGVEDDWISFNEARFIKQGEMEDEPSFVMLCVNNRNISTIQRYIDRHILADYIGFYVVDLEMNTMVTARDEHLRVKDAKMAFRQYDREVERFAKYMQEPFRSTWLSFKDPDVANQLLSTDEQVEYIYRGVDKKWRRCTFYPSGRDKNGRLVSFVVTFMYIDKLAAENMDLAEKVREQKEMLADALQKAEEGSNAKTKFLFNMSHDIRTPMNAILGFNKMAEKHIDDREKVLDCIKKVDSSGKQLLSLINDILDMSRIESGKVQLELHPMSIRETETLLIEMVKETAGKELFFLTDFSQIRHDFVQADPLHMNRVLTNIAGNAVKYTGEGGTVRFIIRETEDDYTYDFIIEDTGIGMSEEFLSHIFEAFSREKTSTVSGIQGTGLGMAITRSLVDLMGGTIEIESRQGVGTRVTVRLTFCPAEEEEKESFSEGECDSTVLSGKRVLLVEDNELNREIARDILEEYGLLVEEAEDGRQAVESYREAAQAGKYPDIILMDIQMPVMNGYEATKVLRRFMMEDGKKVPIVAMTANAFEEDKKQAYEAGMAAHLSKPIVLPELERTLVLILSGKSIEYVPSRDENMDLPGPADEAPEKEKLWEQLLEEDPESAMESLERAAAEDDRDAMFLLGLEYGKRHDNAFRMWLERAAELGHPEAEKEKNRIVEEAYSWEFYAANIIHGSPNLYIIQNLNILLEEVLVKEPAAGDFYTPNPHYVRIERAAQDLKEKTERFCPALTFLDYSEIRSRHWGKVYISSCVDESYLEEIESIEAEEIILVEDGTFDYDDSEEVGQFYRGKKLYLYNAPFAGTRTREAKVLPIERKKDVEERFYALFEEEMEPLRTLPRSTPVLFTAPLIEDCGAIAEDLHKAIRLLEKKLGPCTVVLKKHPRDSFSYRSDVIRFTECSQSVPGQILDMYFTGDKYFFSASTVGAASVPGAHFYAVMVLPENEKYRQHFESFKTLRLFRDKQVTVLFPEETEKE